MDCQTLRSFDKPGLINDALKKVFGKQIERHLQSCAACRQWYAPQSASDNDRVIPDIARTKAVSQTVDDLLDPLPDLSDPVEFKDGPVTFMLHLDGREEEIKVVEPKVDFPLPAGGRLVVRENEVRLTDVGFGFHPEKGRPYELHFTVKAGVSYAEPHVRAYGNPEINDKGLNDNDVFTESIVARAGVEAWIEMRRGTARVYIQYTP